MKLKTLVFSLTVLCSTSVLHAEIVEGRDYIVRSTPIEAVQSDKIEVVEFFGYFCPHCQNLEPLISRQASRFASDTVLRAEHVVWRPEHLPLARLAAAVQASGSKQAANTAIFRTLINDRKDLSNEATFREWAATQPYGSKLIAAYDDPKSQATAARMAELTERYEIASTPVVVVGGKYELTFNGGFEAGMQVMNELIEKVRQERGMPQPAPRAVVSSRGAALAKGANR